MKCDNDVIKQTRANSQDGSVPLTFTVLVASADRPAAAFSATQVKFGKCRVWKEST